MEQKEFQFKTTINCGGCVATVKKQFDQLDGIEHWQVDTDHSDKILRVRSNGITENELVEAVRSCGFKIDPISQE